MKTHSIMKSRSTGSRLKSSMRTLFAMTILAMEISFPANARGGQINIRADATGNVYKNIWGNWAHGTEFWTGVNGSTPDELAWVQFPLSSADRYIILNRDISLVALTVYMSAVSSASGYMYVSDLKGTDLGDGIQYWGPPSGWDESTLATDIRYMYPASNPYFNTFSIANVPVNPYLVLQDGNIYLNRYAESDQSRVVFGIWSDKDYVRFYKHTSSDYAPILTINHRPKAPTSVSASDGTYTDKVRITWGSSSGATAYEVWRHTSNSSGSASKIGDPTSTSYDDTTAVAGTTYYYWIKAVDSENTKSAFSSSNSGYRQIPAPVPPTGVDATDGGSCSVIRIIWESVSGATGYEVWRHTSNNSGSATKLSDVSTTYFDDEVGTGKTYYYWVKAKNTSGSSGFSAPDSGYTDSLPDETANVQASDGSFTDRVRITWSAAPRATKYYIYRDSSLIKEVSGTTYDDLDVVPGTIYDYIVWSANGCGTSEHYINSDDDGYAALSGPLPPTGVSASDGAHSDKVAVTWNASSGATAYEVWRHTSNSSGSASKIADPTGTSYDDTAAVAGTTYYYWVKAKNAGGTSGFSSSDSGYRQIAAPAAPTGVSASDGTYSDKVAVTWNASSGATAYEVWRHTSNSSGSASKIADPTGTSYDDTAAVAGTTYYYWVKAKNAGGTSGFSSSDSGYRQSTPDENLPGRGGMLRILSSGASRFLDLKPDGSVVWSNSSVGSTGRIQISSSINPQWTDVRIFSYTGSVMSTHIGTNP